MPLRQSTERLLPVLNTSVNEHNNNPNYSYGTSTSASPALTTSHFTPTSPMAPFPIGPANNDSNIISSINNINAQNRKLTLMPQQQQPQQGFIGSIPRSSSFNNGQSVGAAAAARRYTGLSSSAALREQDQQHLNNGSTPSFAPRPPNFSPLTTRRTTLSLQNNNSHDNSPQMSAYFSPMTQHHPLPIPNHSSSSSSPQPQQQQNNRYAFIDELKSRSLKSAIVGTGIRPSFTPSLSRRSSAGNLVTASNNINHNTTTNSLSMSSKEHADFPAMLENSSHKKQQISSAVKTIDEETVQFVLQEEEQYKKVLLYFQVFIIVALVYFVGFKILLQ